MPSPRFSRRVEHVSLQQLEECRCGEHQSLLEHCRQGEKTWGAWLHQSTAGLEVKLVS